MEPAPHSTQEDILTHLYSLCSSPAPSIVRSAHSSPSGPSLGGVLYRLHTLNEQGTAPSSPQLPLSPSWLNHHSLSTLPLLHTSLPRGCIPV